jgi:hypothetical protein
MVIDNSTMKNAGSITFLHLKYGTGRTVGPHLVGNVPSQALGHGGEQRVPDALVRLPGRLLVAEAGGLHPDGHVGQHEGHGLVVHDGHAEGLALHRVLGGLVEGSLRDAGGAGRHRRTRFIEGAHGHLEAGSLRNSKTVQLH